MSILLLASCNQAEEAPQDFESPEAFIESLPVVTPKKITEFSSVDSLFFGSLSLDTVPMDDGSFTLADRRGKMILHLDSKGKLIKQIAREGRGPGEILDNTSLTPRPNGGIIAYDQINKKAVFFGANLEFEKEVVLSTSRGGYILNVYDLGEEGGLLTEGGTFNFGPNANNESSTNIALLNSKGESVANGIKIKARQDVALNNGRIFTALPFGDRQLIRYKPKNKTFMTLWTGSNTVVEVNSRFDTLKIIPLNIPAQNISEADIDSLKKEYDDDEWNTIKEELPDQKVAIEKMHIDSENHLWLKLGYQSDYDQWLVTDSEGQPLKIVQLPKGIILTHVSEHHLGVRLGPGTFALYEPVE